MPSRTASNSTRERAITRAYFWVGLLMMVLGISSSVAGQLWPPRALPQDVTSAIFAIQMLRAREPLASFVTTPEPGTKCDDRCTLRKAVRLDFAFIASYATFLILVGVATRGPLQRVLGLIIVVAGLIGATADVIENRRALQLLAGGAVLPRAAAMIKWWSLMLVTAAMAPLTIDRATPPFRRWVGYLSTVVGVVALGTWIYGYVMNTDATLESASGRLPVAWFLAYLFFVTRRALAKGLQAGLDELARWPILRRIARWPDNDDDRDAVGDPIVEPTPPPAR